MEEIITKAKSFATKAHWGQKRRNGDEYITHPERVARQVAGTLSTAEIVGNPDEIVAAAWLHDVVEDCYDDDHAKGFKCLRNFGFPETVIQMVDSVTMRIGELYADYIMRALNGGYGPQLIKAEDLYDNTRDLKRTTKNQIAKYMMAYQLVTGKRLSVPRDAMSKIGK
jgi:hypothetical protein